METLQRQHRQFYGLFVVENAAHVHPDELIDDSYIWPVAHKTTGIYKLAPLVNRWQAILLGGRDYCTAVIVEERVGTDKRAFIVIISPGFECLIDLCFNIVPLWIDFLVVQ